ncbi:neuronal synaptobrevin-like isoform X1 [Scylla paramamosain]|uniref:neuronal synaptobrevin-like isoform X1 n=1 Tax=Scylla paramamosain TaxID=85552 RepID=UPI00308347FA
MSESTEGGASAAGGAAPGGDAPTGENGEIVGGPRGPQQVAAQKRMQQTQAQVDEVVDIMRTNVEKVLERDQKLSELDDRADALQQGASQFEQQAGKLKRKMWWKNLKMMIIMGVIGVIVLIIIVVKLGLGRGVVNHLSSLTYCEFGLQLTRSEGDHLAVEE